MLRRKLFRTAWSYKSQFISMVIMIAIGVGIFLGFNIEWKSIEYDTTKFFDETLYADYRLYSSTGFSEDDIERVKDIPGVDAATRFFAVSVDVKDTKKSLALNVSEDYNVSVFHLMDGKEYDRPSDGVWLSDRFAEENGYKIGDTLTLIYKSIEMKLEIVGLIKSGENMICTGDSNQLMPDFSSYGFAYVTPDTLREALGADFYPQINLISSTEKAELEDEVKDALDRTILVSPKDDHMSYAGAKSETEEGETMGSILPVLFLAIAILTMVTTMHRIAANEKTQIGTLKALGFRDRRILAHYTSYGLVIGLIGTGFGIILGYLVAEFIMNPGGAMGTYFDLPEWKLVMPSFCIPVMVLTLLFLTLISYLSVKRMLHGTAADALRPYVPRPMKKGLLERLPLWEHLGFGTRWNIRDVMRHKSRSAMTLVGILGCMILLVGGLGMKDTMSNFMTILDDDASNYTNKINLAENIGNDEARELCDSVSGDFEASEAISLDGETVTLEVHSTDNEKFRFIDSDGNIMKLGDDGVYLCLRLADTAEVGDTIEFSPYGSDETYKVKVAGYFRSMLTKSIVMTSDFADAEGIDYKITSIYTDEEKSDIPSSSAIAGVQEKQAIIDSYDTFMDIMNMMVAVLVVAAVTLGAVVLYNLGVMSYIERSRELATLKVLGYRDCRIARLLISQNVWMTVIGVALGLPAGIGTLNVLVAALASEYELKVVLGVLTYSVSMTLTFGVSLLVGWAVARKNRKIDMVEALKFAE